MSCNVTIRGRRRYIADELAELVIRTLQANLDRLLGVKILLNLVLGWKSSSCSPAARPVCEISTSRFGISVLPGNCRSIVPNERSISASCAR